MAEQTKRLTDAELEALRGHTPRPKYTVIRGTVENNSRWELIASDADRSKGPQLVALTTEDAPDDLDAVARVCNAHDELLAEVIERRTRDAAVAELVEAAYHITTLRDPAEQDGMQMRRLRAALAAVRGGA